MSQHAGHYGSPPVSPCTPRWRSEADRELVVYSAAEKRFCTALLAGFRERHPGIEVDFHEGISVALHQRHLAELAAGCPRADVIWSSAMDLQMELALSGGALAYTTRERAALPEGAVYRDRAYATTAEPLVTLVHREHFDPGIAAGTAGELAAALAAARERLRCRVAAYDIERNGLGFFALACESRCGAEFDAFLRALAACRPRLCASNRELVEEVASGRAFVAFHVLASYAARALRSHPALALAATNAPPLAIARVALIPSRAPHRRAARRFLDYLLSREGQRRLDEAGLFAIRADCGGSTPRALPPRLDQGFEQLLDARRRREILRRWREALAAAAAPAEVSSSTGGFP